MKNYEYIILSGWLIDPDILKKFMEKALPEMEGSLIDWKGLTHMSAIRERVIERVQEKVWKNPEKLFLVGWSLGSLAALEAALEFPGRISGLILFSSTPCFIKQEGYKFGWEARLLERMKSGLEYDLHKVKVSFLEQLFSFCEIDFYKKYKPIINTLCPEDTIESLAAGLDYLLLSDFRERLSSIKVPSLLIHGAQDNLCPSGAAEYISHHIGAYNSYELLEDAGHMPFLTREEECIKLIRKVALNKKGFKKK